jgi:putative toxin-antitoxin system antitoxin component (TIGR02293 family)
MREAIETHKVADLLGLNINRKGGYTMLEFSAEIARGLPVTAIDRVRKTVAPDMASFPQLIASESTLKRYRKARKALNAAQSERLARIAEVWAAAIDIYQDEETARTFLHRGHSLLGGRKPLDLAVESSAGARSVEQLLGRLKYGSVA